MRRLTDIYAQLAADRDAKAQLCCILVLEKEWDRAAAAARDFEALQDQCSALVLGHSSTISGFTSDDPDPGPRAA